MMRICRMLLSTPWWGTLILLFFVSGCNLPASTAPAPIVVVEETPDTIYTVAVQTVIAQLTLNAPTPTPTEIEILPEATLSLEMTSTPGQAASSSPLPTGTATITPTATGSPEPAEATQPPDPVLDFGEATWEDTFDPPEAWALISDDHSHFEITNGQLEMTSYNADFWNSWALTQPIIEVFYMEAEGSSGICSGLDRWGLFFRAPDYTQGYLFGVSCDGRFAFWVWNGIQEIYLVEWTESPHILKGDDQVNRIGVHADGNRFVLYANGYLLTEVRDDSYASGRFGLFVGAAETPGFTVNVDRIAYWENP